MTNDSHLIQALRNQGCLLTRQRLLVLEILQEIPGHLDAAMIFQEAKKRDARISLATIYRSLAVLKAAGLVEENRLGEGHAHFEPIQDAHHYHFTCQGCGKVIEFAAPGLPEVVRAVSERENLRVTEITFHLGGYCPDCSRSASQT